MNMSRSVKRLTDHNCISMAKKEMEYNKSISKEQHEAIAKERALEVIFKGYCRLGTIGDVRMFLVQLPRTNGKGHIYHVNIESYPICNCLEFA